MVKHGRFCQMPQLQFICPTEIMCRMCYPKSKTPGTQLEQYIYLGVRQMKHTYLAWRLTVIMKAVPLG